VTSVRSFAIDVPTIGTARASAVSARLQRRIQGLLLAAPADLRFAGKCPDFALHKILPL
jgi:hypothetical protein